MFDTITDLGSARAFDWALLGLFPSPLTHPLFSQGKMSNESTIAGSSTKIAIMDAAAIESDHDESDLEPEGESSSTANQGASSSAGKKKKKKKSKASKLLNKLKGNGEDPDELPQEVVDKVMEEIRTQGTLSPEELTAENIRQALQEMKILEVVKGKAGIGGLNPKDMGEHKVRVRSACLARDTPLIYAVVLGNSTRSTNGYGTEQDGLRWVLMNL